MLQIIAVSTAILVSNLDYVWHDKRTRKFKSMRLFLYLLTVITLILSIVVSIQDDKQHKNEIKQLTFALDTLQKQTSEIRIEAKHSGIRQKSQMELLIESNKILRESLAPFQELAKERYPGMGDKKALEKLELDIAEVEKRATEIEDTMKSIPEYGLVAKIDFLGFDETIPNGMGVTKLYQWGGKYIKENGNNTITQDCSSKAINHYKSVIEKYPNFPFPYIVIGRCYKLNKNIEWSEYIKIAQKIFRVTTKIPFHAISHDQALQEANSLLLNIENQSKD